MKNYIHISVLSGNIKISCAIVVCHVFLVILHVKKILLGSKYQALSNYIAKKGKMADVMSGMLDSFSVVQVLMHRHSHYAFLQMTTLFKLE